MEGERGQAGRGRAVEEFDAVDALAEARVARVAADREHSGLDHPFPDLSRKCEQPALLEGERPTDLEAGCHSSPLSEADSRRSPMVIRAAGRAQARLPHSPRAL